jgi:hypothetical protein
MERNSEMAVPRLTPSKVLNASGLVLDRWAEFVGAAPRDVLTEGETTVDDEALRKRILKKLPFRSDPIR